MINARWIECCACGRRAEVGAPLACECGGRRTAAYDFDSIRRHWRRSHVAHGGTSMWRYAPVLPVSLEAALSLGEGWTPLLAAGRTGAALGLGSLRIKEEGLNPAGSGAAREMAAAVSMLRLQGARHAALADSSDAAAALAAYAAAAGIQAHVTLASDVGQADLLACQAAGAQVTLSDAGEEERRRIARERAASEGWAFLDPGCGTMRFEGAKTIGYEIAEQMGWEVPEAVLIPAGHGVTLVAIWRAFDEMSRLGWISGRRPRMIAVQAEGCEPLVRAWQEGAECCEVWKDAHTVAAGLRVTAPAAGGEAIAVLRASRGCAVAVPDAAMIDAGLELLARDGVWASIEGAACLAALPGLVASGAIEAGGRTVVVNPASGVKSAEVWATRFPRAAADERDKLGGLITPR
jgi:threonine synthase